MSSPDLAAAQYVEQAPTWKGQPPPPVGARINAQWLASEDGRTRTQHRYVTVEFEPTVENGKLTIPYRDKPYDALGANPQRTIVLSEDCLIDQWYPLGLAPVATLPEPAFQATESEPAETTSAPEADAQTLPGMLRRWLYVDNKLKEAVALVKTLKEEKDQINQAVVDECVSQGYSKPPGVGDMTFSFKPVYFTEYVVNEDGDKASTDDVVAALHACGLATGVVKEGYNGNTLKAVLRELTEGGQPLPEALAAVVTLTSRTELSATRSAARNRRGRAAAETD